ncbi:MAG TPA: hypothetical protein ENL03_02505, partial [Phycisphaerae bacterium]|nr:hypothetical protein [Phycisphaerae bacterium]
MAAILDDTGLNDAGIEIVNRVGRREITHVIHDIDGTHSLIRDWPPVMSLSMYWAKVCGYGEGYDSDENAQKLIDRVGRDELPEMYRICHENAGFSAITQLEYGVRRAIQDGNVPSSLPITDVDRERNLAIINILSDGRERY